MRDVILTGFMGTGKTTVGRILAERFGLRFMDLDAEIERRAGTSISDLFDSEGETGFRRLETDVLRELAGGGGRVIATGGGALIDQRNRDLLDADQAIVCLTCRPDELARRLDGGAGRPMLQPDPAARILQLLAERRAAYDRFEQVDTTDRSPEDVAEEVARMLDLATADHLQFQDVRRTSILCESGLVDRLGAALAQRDLRGTALLVTDQTVASIGLVDRVEQSLTHEGYVTHRVALPSGETHKTLDSLATLFDACVERGLDRDAVVIGVGGGVVGDVAGMLAATYLRGLRLVLVPTTLVAQVDAAIGGKVGVDLHGIKNLVGAFHPAEVVAIDPDTLHTLPDSRLADGLAEIVKIAMMRSPHLLERLEELREPRDILECPGIIREAAREKVRVVQRDPYERGERALLNFGHTVGHAVEAASDFGLSHGAAISVGMTAETWLAVVRGWCDHGVLDRLVSLLDRFTLPSTSPGLDPDLVYRFAGSDKKRKDGDIRLAVPTAPGEGTLAAVSPDDLMTTIQHAIGGSQ